MSISSKSVPGMIYPEQNGMIGKTAAQSAMLAGNNKAQLQAEANRLMAGGRIKRRYIGGDITVPQFPNSNSSSLSTNKLIAGNAKTSIQMSANSVYDAGATQMGGMRMGGMRMGGMRMGGMRRKEGGNPNWVWGCMSGGKKKSKRKSRKSRKSRRKH